MEKVEFFENGNISYQGNFEEGKYQGFGKKYTLQGHLQYQGHFEAGLPNGEGVLFTRTATIEGCFINGKLTGKVKITDNASQMIHYQHYENGICLTK